MFSSYQSFLNLPNLGASFTALFVLIAAWSIVWKGIALWKAARNSQRGWYIAMLVINTAGILEIIYILFFSKKNQAQQEKQ